LQRDGCHRLRLPGFAIVAVDLHMSDRIAERRAAGMAHRQQRDLEIECDESLDDHTTLSGATALLRVFPRSSHARLRAHQTLSLPGRAHHRLDDAWQPD